MKNIVAGKMSLRICLLVFFIGLFLPQVLLAQREIPELWGTRVHDEAKVLNQQTVDLLEIDLKKYEDSTTNQIAILIVNTLDGETIEDYGIRVAEKWKLGTKSKDNGVILIIATDDHKMRIEVGQGLEGVLTDAISNRIIRNEMAPAFRRNDFDEGVKLATKSIVKAIGGEYKTEDSNSGTGEMSIGERIITGLFVFGILGVFTLIAVFSGGCAGWGLYAFLIPFYAIFPGAVVGFPVGLSILAIYAVGFPILKVTMGRTAWGKDQLKKWKNIPTSSSKSSSGGWFSSSGWGSSFSGGSGFSGGGGSFGGGGSSGSW